MKKIRLTITSIISFTSIFCICSITDEKRYSHEFFKNNVISIKNTNNYLNNLFFLNYTNIMKNIYFKIIL